MYNMDFWGDSRGYLYSNYPQLMKSLEVFSSLLPEDNYLSFILDDRDDDFEVQIRKRPKKRRFQWFHKKQVDQQIDKQLEDKLNLLCCAYTSSGVDRVVAFAKLNMLAKDIWQLIEIPDIQVRLFNSQNEVFYDNLSNLYFTDDSFYCSNEESSMVKARYAGIYLGFQDRNGKRVYEGDIVLAKAKEDHGSRRFWGLIAELGKIRAPFYMPQIILYHGGDSFPSYLSWASEFEVLANYFADIDFEINKSQEFDYKYDWRPYEELCENRAKELGWPRY